MVRHTLLGVEVDALTLDELNEYIENAIGQQRFGVVVANHNLHSIYLFHHNEEMRALYRQAEIIHIDGMLLVLWGRLLGLPLEARHRVTYVDWIFPLMELSWKRRWRVFYLGGKPGVAEKAAQKLREKYPGLSIITRHGYFDMAGVQNEEVLETINNYQPHLLLVGMGMPRQEVWVLRNRDRLTANVILTSGACFDYIAGAIPTPPRWLGSLGLEWLYRLFSEPRRLWKRYLLEPWALVPFAWSDLLRKVRER